MDNQAELLEFENETRSLGDYVNVIRRRKRVFAIATSVVMVVVITATFLWPKTFRSQAIILIEQQEISSYRHTWLFSLEEARRVKVM